MTRLQTEIIKKDLEKKLVFLVGPRQVGKTWLAKELAAKWENSRGVFKNPLIEPDTNRKSI
jgi:uncharacterized protein